MPLQKETSCDESSKKTKNNESSQKPEEGPVIRTPSGTIEKTHPPDKFLTL